MPGIKMFQSENGLTGNGSPNFEINEAVFDAFEDYFPKDDLISVIAISTVGVGHRYKQEEDPIVEFRMYKGGNRKLHLLSLRKAFKEDPELKEIIQEALKDE
ncbi:MAG TPA: hypothetical protein VHA52_00335 [Candidatus Babeliaceae bacterium]|nr:hypothetical protein [Candidatus Babeliaceae bacterium]